MNVGKNDGHKGPKAKKMHASMQIANQPPLADNGINVTLFKESQSLPIEGMSQREQWNKKVQQNRKEKRLDPDYKQM